MTKPTALDATAIARARCTCGATVVMYDDQPGVARVTIVPDGRTRAGRMFRRLPKPTWPWQCGACDMVEPYEGNFNIFSI